VKEIAGTDTGLGQMLFAQALRFAQGVGPMQRGVVEDIIGEVFVAASERSLKFIKGKLFAKGSKAKRGSQFQSMERSKGQRSGQCFRVGLGYWRWFLVHIKRKRKLVSG